MKKSKLLIFLCIVLLSASSLRANPIVPRIFSEILIDPTNWAIELDLRMYGYELFEIDLDSCVITSLQDTMAIKHCQFINEVFWVITPDSLEENFTINFAGDILTLQTLSGQILDLIYFGVVANDTLFFVKPGQSVCFYSDSYYIDNTPTIGSENDWLNAMGTVQGTLTDSCGNPCVGLLIFCVVGAFYEQTLSCDSSGFFSINLLATTVIFANYINEEYEYRQYSMAVYPESTLTVHFVFNKIQNSVEASPGISPPDYFLSDGYPNPFNQVTYFQYRIPRDDYVKIEIYDIAGRLVENLFSGFQAKGDYRLLWDAFNAPSGLYFIRLQTPQTVLNKKCLLVK